MKEWSMYVKYVILLHGLGSNKLLMKPIEWALSSSSINHKIINVDFSSFFNNYINIINEVALKLYDHIIDPEEIVFVGHSLGGMVAADISKLFVKQCSNIKCITLGTPYKGAILADIILKFAPVICDKYIPMVRELSRTDGFHVDETNIPHYVIIGTKKISLLNPLSWVTNLLLFFEYEHDGVVDLRKHDFDMLKNKQLYFQNVDHISMVFDPQINNIIINIIKNES